MTDSRALVVADDLTGAMDTGHAFAARGYSTVVRLTGDPSDETVLVRNTDSRYASSMDARHRVENIVQAHPDAIIYKKIDSTLRGNLIPEIEAVIDTADADLAVVAPAFPSNNRITTCGYHLVHGNLATNIDIEQDSEKSIPSSHLPTLFSSADFPVVHLPIQRIAPGETATRDSLVNLIAEADTPAIVVCDTTHKSHLTAIVNAASELDNRVVYVGSAGLAEQVVLPEETTSSSIPFDLDLTDNSVVNRTIFGVIGSAHPQTLEQITALSDEQIVRLDASAAVINPEEIAMQTADICIDRLQTHGKIILASATSQDDIDTTYAAASKYGISRSKTREHIAATLAAVTREVWNHRPPEGLLLSGGAIAGRTLNELDSEGLWLTGKEVTSGIPLGRILGGKANSTPVVTKAGAFGERKTLTRCLNFLVDNDTI